MALLKVDHIKVHYGLAQALADVSLEINEGQIVTILGANGAGKTTTLRAISGIVRPSAGTIVFDGEDITKVPPEKLPYKGVVQVPEGRGIFFDLTVAQNLILGGIHGTKTEEFRKTLDSVYKFFPILYEKRNDVASSLSGGQQQMLSVGRTLLTQPKILMLDELSFGLAPVIVNELFKMLRQLNKDTGLTVLLVEQNVGMALKLADYAYVLSNGRVVASGPASEIAADEGISAAYLGGAGNK